MERPRPKITMAGAEGRARTPVSPPSGISDETMQAGIEAYQELVGSGEIPGTPLTTTHHETKGSTARGRYLQRADQAPEEEGLVEEPRLPIQSVDIERPRATDNVRGNEVVFHSSKNPVKITPPSNVSAMELHRHRADSHTRKAHWVSDKLTWISGPVDGVIDAGFNFFAEMIENGAFLVSKTIESAKYGWERGKIKAQDKER